ncbi:S8 family serine peptidase [Kordia sp. YSTF-M3]|uniref:S8 family serine peptidase n=1 Tax=Kordia aestuariivivens TaxID=2759037 RepID=A0ABR7Q9K8_9FLAO|nr:S8 family serine peptidase [Kordia aestuariivivens]MBC8755252.1 S8 family serine peptidase [Kordia aestuariivivens]
MKFLKPFLIIFLSCCCIIACTSLKSTIVKPIIVPNLTLKKSKLTIPQWRNWIHKDIVQDTIPGISLDKAYNELIKEKLGDTIIVALLDNRIDSEHEEIKDYIWVNNKEIPNNGIDDDKNGYTDDVNGWNFLGNGKGENVDRANFEATRIVRKYKDVFESKEIEDIPQQLKKEFDLYRKAKRIYDDYLNLTEKRIASLDSFDKRKKDLYNDLSKIYHDSLLSEKSIAKLLSKDSIINIKIASYRYYLKHSGWSSSTREVQSRYLDIYLGLNSKERSVIGDNVDNIEDADYGNGNITASKTSSHDHAIKVAGILAANRVNGLGIKGVSNILKIMPVCTSPSGDEQDKDIALGIKYAVNNGAKIIIITFTKYIVQREDWLMDAINYASSKDVLIVLSAGNSAKDSDLEITYPNDINEQNNEYVNNVIVVGGSSSSLNEELVADFSNYGKRNVDIFAPAKSIYTTLRNNEYGYESGTSMSAPIVAGIASLIRSYYPNLSASEVKQIIMESGVSYDIMVNKPSTSKEKKLVPFSSLSKSGKIVNAYNALVLAAEVSKKKKRN